jgi:peptidoglycan hydrolase CwlO-like protein
MSELDILRAQKRRLISKLGTLQGTLKKTKNSIDDVRQQINNIEHELKTTNKREVK